ncbi:hypothetical protein C8T65DRAFT_652531 [Cerioporus squamosus]|nr:hypothetical protein C8T65DRAFT_652531 [Cerioporus squamosus]
MPDFCSYSSTSPPEPAPRMTSSLPRIDQGGPYDAISRKVETMLDHTANMPDEALLRLAREHLEILDLDQYASLNRPECFNVLIASGRISGRTSDFSIGRLFDTMLRVTDELGMSSARRYVSAAICACAAHWGEDGTLSQVAPDSDVQAARLSYLAVVWIAYALWPHVAKTGTMMPEREEALRVDQTTTQVLMRDNFTCCLTGVVDMSVEGDPLLKGHAAYSAALEPVRIFDAVDEVHKTKTESLAITVELLQRIYQCPPIIVDDAHANIPQNSYFLQPDCQYSIAALHSCLTPTEVPHRYRVTVYRPTGGMLPTEIPQYLDFKDHTLDEVTTRFWPSEHSCWFQDAQPDQSLRGVPLPDVTLLRGRAALTGICTRAGSSCRWTNSDISPRRRSRMWMAIVSCATCVKWGTVGHGPVEREQ